MSDHGHGGGGHDDNDPLGKKVGVQAAILAVILAIITISSHRAHTEAVMRKASESDNWNFYQATRLKSHNIELGEDLLSVLAAKSEAAEKVEARYKADKDKYEKRAEEIKKKAEDDEKACERAEKQAFHFDVGEGLVEIGLVLSSLYFIAKKKFFPVIGLISAIAGMAIAIVGALH